ncbi:MAG: lipoprotein [Burkholderiales bacterium]
MAAARVSAVVALVLAVTGCGQKGGLFLPRDPAAAQRAPLPAAIGSTLPDFGGYQDRDSPVPALPSAPATVVSPTPAASNTPVPADSSRRVP